MRNPTINIIYLLSHNTLLVIPPVRANPAEKPHKAAETGAHTTRSVAGGVVASAIYRQKSILHGFLWSLWYGKPDYQASATVISESQQVMAIMDGTWSDGGTSEDLRHC